MPDRYADAVQARRRELRELREGLTGAHRGELRSCLALSRLAAAAHASAAFGALRREAAEHLRRLRRIASERGLAMEPGWPRMPGARAPGPPPPPDRATPGTPLLAGLVEGAALWRLALLPLAALPLAGLPGPGGPALAPLAVGAGGTAVVVAARARRGAAERDRLHRRVEQIVAAGAAAIEADLDRRLVELEPAASAALDAAVLRRRATVDRELAALAPEGVGSGG